MQKIFCRIYFQMSVRNISIAWQKLQSRDFRNIGFEHHFLSAPNYRNRSHQTAEIKDLGYASTHLQ